MSMTFTTRIPAQHFGPASETTIPGFQPHELSASAPAQFVEPDPDHVFEQSFLKDFALWWSWFDTRTPLYISGPTGCGKTTSVLQFLARVNVPVISVTCSRRFVKDDLVGRWGAHEGSFAWFDGPATTAWKTGCVLLINEFSLAPAEVWVSANDIFEGQPITIEKAGVTVARHVNTRVIVTDNCRCGCAPELRYASRSLQDASTCDRFWHMSADWPEQADERRILAQKCRQACGGALAESLIEAIARSAAAFAAATRKKSSAGKDAFAQDGLPAVSTRVALRMSEILATLLAHKEEFGSALQRAVSLALGGALTGAQSLALLELAAFHFESVRRRLKK